MPLAPETAKDALSNTEAEQQNAIRLRAEEIYKRNGEIPGRDQENWFQAETEILQEQAQRQSGNPAVIVRVGGKQYIGEYSAEASDGYLPGEFAYREPVRVRFAGDKMYLKRGNGKELETKLVKA